jgi:hypothetical protein
VIEWCVELTKRFSEADYAKALESWSWVDLRGKTPRFTSLFGDVFLEGEAGDWWLLDTLEGELVRGWASAGELADVLETEKGQDRYLLGGLAMAAFHRRGLQLGESDVYAWAPPPVIGGSFDADTIRVFKFVVVVNAAGQLHRQLRGGTAS